MKFECVRMMVKPALLGVALSLALCFSARAQELPANPLAAPAGGAPSMFDAIRAAKGEAPAPTPAAAPVSTPPAAAPTAQAGEPAAKPVEPAKAAKAEPAKSEAEAKVAAAKDGKGKKGKAAKPEVKEPPKAPEVAAPVAPPPPAAAPAPAAESRATAAGLKVRKPSEVNDAPIAGVTLKFDNADIYEVVQAVLGDILHLNYLLDPSIQGKITLNTNGTVSSADVYGILESVLQLNNLSIVRDGKLYKIVRDPNAPKDNLSFEAAGENSPMIEIIPMQFVQASALLNVLNKFIGPQAGIINDATNRYLIVADRAANIAKLKEMVKTLDVDYLQKVRIRVIPVIKGDATEMAKEMDLLFKTSGLFNWPGTDGNKVFFMPVVRMNSLLVAGANDAILDAAEMWIKKLDDEPKDGVGAGIHVYPVANSSAIQIANLLRQLYGGAPIASTNTTGTTGTAATRTVTQGAVPTATAAASAGANSGLSGAVQIIPDEATNTIIIKANQQDFLQIKKVIERLDAIPRQVLIQVMVAEVTLTGTLSYGVEWWLKNEKFSNGGKNWAAQAGLSNGATLPTGSPLNSATAGFNYAIFNSAGDVSGLLSILASDTKLNLLSTPHVMTSDGKTAKIEVGQEVPIVTQTVSTATTGTTAGTTSNSVSYRQTGVLLEVKPSINASGRVSLSLSQEVSDKLDSVTVAGSAYPAFTKRKVETNVTLEEGKTLMIAGLIQDKKNGTVTGLPGLKDIPLLGALFGSTADTTEKVELIITITPYIVRGRDDADQLTRTFEESIDSLKNLIKKSPVRELNNPERRSRASDDARAGAVQATVEK